MRAAYIAVAILGCTLGACASRATTAPPASQRQNPPYEVGNPQIDPGIDVTALDPKISACDDFYQFACGGWIARTQIPPDRPAWHRSFSEITETNLERLKKTLEQLQVESTDETGRKLGDFYAACMDETQAEAASRRSLDAALQNITRLKNKNSLAPLLADLHARGVDAVFEFGAIQDFKDAQQMIAAADQAGLGLPDREYYLKQDPASRKILTAYEQHVARLLDLAGGGAGPAQKSARRIVALETQLAKHSMDKVLRRQPENIYHRLEHKGLVALAPIIDWAQYFAVAGVPQVQAINVMSPQFFAGVQKVITATPMDDLKLYLQWRLLDAAAPALGVAFVEESFRFRQVLTGEEQLLPRWKRCLSAVEGAMGQALGKSFVTQTFSEASKSKALALVRGIEEAFSRNLHDLEWMDEPTRAAAKEKLDGIYNKIGYPDKWRSFDKLIVDRTSDLANRFAASAFETRRDLAKIGQPIDRTEWHMTPQAVNAYYDALMNEMVFPAGILQAPFFDASRSPSENFGAVGMVMGHELTHGFDDEGRKFDAVGNLRDWWTPAAVSAFEQRARCVVAQYKQYKIAPDVAVNGELTLGENIADIGGLKLAHAAWSHEQPATDSPNERAAAPVGSAATAYSPAQRFFISFAQSWCSKPRDAYARMLVNVDPHSPTQFRVNGSVSNHPAFQSAFKCNAGAAMAPVTRCQIW